MHGKRSNPKHEIRNPKSETNPKAENPKTQTVTSHALTHGVAVRVWNFLLFGFWDLFRISDFVLRIYIDSRANKRTK